MKQDQPPTALSMHLVSAYILIFTLLSRFHFWRDSIVFNGRKVFDYRPGLRLAPPLVDAHFGPVA